MIKEFLKGRDQEPVDNIVGKPDEHAALVKYLRTPTIFSHKKRSNQAHL